MTKKLTREQYHKALIGKVPLKYHKEMLEEFDKDKVEEPELIHKAMNNINTFQCHKRELYLGGTDEYGKDFQVVFDALDFIEWIDTEQLEYIKEELIKHIKEK